MVTHPVGKVKISKWKFQADRVYSYIQPKTDWSPEKGLRPLLTVGFPNASLLSKFHDELDNPPPRGPACCSVQLSIVKRKDDFSKQHSLCGRCLCWGNLSDLGSHDNEEEDKDKIGEKAHRDYKQDQKIWIFRNGF